MHTLALEEGETQIVCNRYIIHSWLFFPVLFLSKKNSFALTDDESFDVRMRPASYLQRCVAVALCRSEITAAAIVYAHWKHVTRNRCPACKGAYLQINTLEERNEIAVVARYIIRCCAGKHMRSVREREIEREGWGEGRGGRRIISS